MKRERGRWMFVLGLLLVGCGAAPVTGNTEAGATAALSSLAVGASGTLDPAYGERGVAHLEGNRTWVARGLVQSDGQVVMVGHGAKGGQLTSFLRRLTAGGQPDTAFNDSGATTFLGTTAMAALQCPQGANRYNDWGAECQDPQRIVVARSSAATDALTLSRLLPSGQPDPSFGVQGQVTPALSVGEVLAVLIQSDGRVVVVGSDGLARFRRNGEVDPTFGTNGFAALAVNGWVQDVVMDPAERFLVLTNSDDGTAPRTQVQRLTQSGRPDPGYGAGGQTTLEFGPSGTGQALLVLHTGRVVVGGTGGLWRLLPGGAPDPTFGTAGHATFEAADGGDFVISGLVEDRQNRLTASVLTSERFAPTLRGNLARFRFNGTLDPSFGSGGLAHVALCPPCTATNGLAEFSAVAVLRNGRLLGLGTGGRRSGLTNLIAARMFP